MAAASRIRLASTAAGSSPTWSPRLKVSNGGAETPPARVVVTRRIRTLTYPVSGSRSTDSPRRHAALLPRRFAARLVARLAPHERRHVDVVVFTADVQGRAIRVQRNADRVRRFEQARADLAGLAGLEFMLVAPADPADDRLAARSARVEARRDDGDPHFVAQGVVDDGAENDVGVLVGGVLHQRGRL